MVSTVRPKASDTPNSPMPTCGKPAAITALPQPPKVSQNVPIASAAYFLPFMRRPPVADAFAASAANSPNHIVFSGRAGDGGGLHRTGHRTFPLSFARPRHTAGAVDRSATGLRRGRVQA